MISCASALVLPPVSNSLPGMRTMQTADFDHIKDNHLRTQAKFLSVEIDELSVPQMVYLQHD